MDQAEIKFSCTIQNVQNYGLKSLYQELAITDEKLGASSNHMKTLKNHKKIKWYNENLTILNLILLNRTSIEHNYFSH